MSRRLEGRRIVVTGAASGIGTAIARLFAGEGAALTLLDMSDGVAEIAREMGGHGFTCDVTDENAVNGAVRQGAAAMGGIDGLVTSAGIWWRGSVLDVGIAEFRRVVDINLTGTYITVRACLPFLNEAEAGTIVTVGSGQGLLPNMPNCTAYAASKAGVANMTRALGAELAPKIRANCLCPGLVDTPLATNALANVSAPNLSAYALGRLAQPDEIAKAALFLTGDDSSYATGAVFAVDGGRTYH